MFLVDTHTHLYSEVFNEDLDTVIQRAREQKVEVFLQPAIDSSTHQAMMKIQDIIGAGCFTMIGLHPTSVKENVEEELEFVYDQLQTPYPYVGIGEIGMDLYWDKTFLEQQKYAFRKQIQWAKQYKMPIAIHCREAFDEIFEILEEEKSSDLRGVFHCFTGNLEQANKAIELGFKLGIGGVVTFKKAGLDKTLASVDLKHIILETDSPYLAPTPHRGKRNESSYVSIVAEKIAEIYNLPLEEVAEITSKTALYTFDIAY